MPRKPTISKRDPNPTSPRTVSEKGKAPWSRFINASQVWQICNDMIRGDTNRAKKRSRIFKAYYRFPPTEYSTLVKLKRENDSNVNWGQMAFIVDNMLSSFYDLVTERNYACDIETSEGDDEQQKAEWSQHITFAFDKYALRLWDDYLLNHEQHQLDMLLYGKGLEIRDDDDGYETEHCPADEILVPDDAEITLKKFDVVARPRRFHLHTLYNRIKDRKAAESRGWNVDAVISAMRWQRKDWSQSYTNEQFLHSVAEGKVALSSVMREHVDVFEFYGKEYSGEITKFIVLRYYNAPGLNVPQIRGETKDDYEKSKIDTEGFLFAKQKYAEDIRDVISVFIDSPGSGEWHNTPSLAEKVFVQCRQYDIVQNNIADAIRINMTLILAGQGAEANERLKRMVWGGSLVLPTDTNFVQHRVQMDVSQATQTLRLMMSDMHEGIGNYRVQNKDEGGGSPTATQANIDATESAKLKNTQIRRYAEQSTEHHKRLYKFFISLTRGQSGYDRFVKFKRYLKKQGVPESAWKFDNIDAFSSNIVAGAGSPSYKLMAAQKTIDLTNLSPKDDGQRNAIEDAIAAVQTRANVRRYMPKKSTKDPDEESRRIGFENESFGNPILNPNNVAVHPSDNDVRHIAGHLEDMAQTTLAVERKIQDGQLTEDVAKYAMTRLMNQGGHVGAHMQKLAKDATKRPLYKGFAKDLLAIQRQVQKLQSEMAVLLKNKQQEFDPSKDPDILKKMALSQIELDSKQKLADLKIGSIATSHEARQQITRDKASQELAIQRAKGEEEIQKSRRKATENGSE